MADSILEQFVVNKKWMEVTENHKHLTILITISKTLFPHHLGFQITYYDRTLLDCSELLKEKLFLVNCSPQTRD